MPVAQIAGVAVVMVRQWGLGGRLIPNQQVCYGLLNWLMQGMVELERVCGPDLRRSNSPPWGSLFSL